MFLPILNSKAENITHLLINDFLWKPESRNLCAYHPSTLGFSIKDSDLITKWC